MRLIIFICAIIIIGCQDQSRDIYQIAIDDIVRPLPPPPPPSPGIKESINQSTLDSLLLVTITVGVDPYLLDLSWEKDANGSEVVTKANYYRLFKYEESSIRLDSGMVRARESISFMFYDNEEDLLQNRERLDGILRISNFITDLNNEFYYILVGYQDHNLSSKLILYQFRRSMDKWELVGRFPFEKS